jgi:hypothetical protein
MHCPIRNSIHEHLPILAQISAKAHLCVCEFVHERIERHVDQRLKVSSVQLDEKWHYLERQHCLVVGGRMVGRENRNEGEGKEEEEKRIQRRMKENGVAWSRG